MTTFKLANDTLAELAGLQTLLPEGVTIDLVVKRAVSTALAELGGLTEPNLTNRPVYIPTGPKAP